MAWNDSMLVFNESDLGHFSGITVRLATFCEYIGS